MSRGEGAAWGERESGVLVIFSAKGGGCAVRGYVFTGGRGLFAGTYVFDLQLDVTALVAVLFDGVADVEGALGLDVACLRTLAKGDAVHNAVALVVDEFQLDMFLSATDHFARTIVVDALGAE